MDKNGRYSTIDEYIARYPLPVRKKLNQIRQLVKELAPEATEKISYRMPTFFLNGNVVHFAAYTRHIGLYPTSSGTAHFASELTPYKHSKGAIQFPLDEELPLGLIRRIVEFRVAENRKKSLS
ncbi:MAG: iron chaperone [Anaerolineales bacterium]|jgi:uncharacterized protein YdhG (YjbR/CyaY superfamily)